jgi:hypothetical protein
MYSTVRPEVELTLDRAREVFTKELKALDDTELDAKAYDNPAWAYKQAYKNGYRKAMRVVEDLLRPKENSNNGQPI